MSVYQTAARPAFNALNSFGSVPLRTWVKTAIDELAPNLAQKSCRILTHNLAFLKFIPYLYA